MYVCLLTDLEPDTVYQVLVLAGTKVGFPDLHDDRWKWISHKTPVSDIRKKIYFT